MSENIAMNTIFKSNETATDRASAQIFSIKGKDIERILDDFNSKDPSAIPTMMALHKMLSFIEGRLDETKEEFIGNSLIPMISQSVVSPIFESVEQNPNRGWVLTQFTRNGRAVVYKNTTNSNDQNSLKIPNDRFIPGRRYLVSFNITDMESGYVELVDFKNQVLGKAKTKGEHTFIVDSTGSSLRLRAKDIPLEKVVRISTPFIGLIENPLTMYILKLLEGRLKDLGHALTLDDVEDLIGTKLKGVSDALLEHIKANNPHKITPAMIGAALKEHSHLLIDLGAASIDHKHTPEELGAATKEHEHLEYVTKDDLKALGNVEATTPSVITKAVELKRMNARQGYSLVDPITTNFIAKNLIHRGSSPFDIQSGEIYTNIDVVDSLPIVNIFSSGIGLNVPETGRSIIRYDLTMKRTISKLTFTKPQIDGCLDPVGIVRVIFDGIEYNDISLATLENTPMLIAEIVPQEVRRIEFELLDCFASDDTGVAKCPLQISVEFGDTSGLDFAVAPHIGATLPDSAGLYVLADLKEPIPFDSPEDNGTYYISLHKELDSEGKDVVDVEILDKKPIMRYCEGENFIEKNIQNGNESGVVLVCSGTSTTDSNCLFVDEGEYVSDLKSMSMNLEFNSAKNIETLIFKFRKDDPDKLPKRIIVSRVDKGIPTAIFSEDNIIHLSNDPEYFIFKLPISDLKDVDGLEVVLSGVGDTVSMAKMEIYEDILHYDIQSHTWRDNESRIILGRLVKTDDYTTITSVATGTRTNLQLETTVFSEAIEVANPYLTEDIRIMLSAEQEDGELIPAPFVVSATTIKGNILTPGKFIMTIERLW